MAATKICLDLQKEEEAPAAEAETKADQPKPGSATPALQVGAEGAIKVDKGAPGSRWIAKVILMGGVDKE